MLFFTASLFVSKNTFAVQIIIGENEWPCKLNHLEDYKLSYFWSNNNITLNENWKKEKDVLKNTSLRVTPAGFKPTTF